MDNPSRSPDEQFAEWYVWAKREVSTDNRVCLGAAQAGMVALDGGADLQTARLAARRSVAGHGVGLVDMIEPRRRAYAEWYDWARREVGGGAERQHAAVRAALDALDGGASAQDAAAAARRVSEPASDPPSGSQAETQGSPPVGAATQIVTHPVPTAESGPAAVIAPSVVYEAPAPPGPPPPPPPAMGATAPIVYAPIPPPQVAYPPLPPPAPAYAYAGFWRRFAAFAIDTVLLVVTEFVLAFVVSFFVVIGLMSSGQTPTDQNLSGASLVLYGILLLLVWLYYAGLESSAWQATVGKRLMGLAVSDMYGRRISFGRATGRYFGKILSALILFAGFWMIPLTPRKQGLHDMMAGTLVARREYLPMLAQGGPLEAATPQGRRGSAGEVQGA